MTYKQIEAARETRLWLGQVIVPACLAVAVACTNPAVRQWCGDKTKVVKNFVKSKFKKKRA